MLKVLDILGNAYSYTNITLTVAYNVRSAECIGK